MTGPMSLADALTVALMALIDAQDEWPRDNGDEAAFAFAGLADLLAFVVNADEHGRRMQRVDDWMQRSKEPAS